MYPADVLLLNIVASHLCTAYLLGAFRRDDNSFASLQIIRNLFNSFIRFKIS
ncbi:MAG: hypothetical protein JWP81_2144 [Ferruginibacter sp.]|nr:hypothetical protein [Ferruginibacter sp.]